MKSKEEKIKKAKKLIKELEALKLSEEEYKEVSGGSLIVAPPDRPDYFFDTSSNGEPR